MLDVVEVTFTFGVPEIVILLSRIDQLIPGGSPSTRADNAPPPNSYEIGNVSSSPSHKVRFTDDDPETGCKSCPFNTVKLPVNASDSHPAVLFIPLMLKLYVVSSLIPVGVPEIVNCFVVESYWVLIPGGCKSHVMTALLAPCVTSITTSVMDSPSHLI